MTTEQYAVMQDMRELRKHLQEGSEIVKRFINRCERLEEALKDTKEKLYNLAGNPETSHAVSPAGQNYIKLIMAEIDSALAEDLEG